MNNEPDSTFLTPKQVSALILVTEETLLHWRQRGHGPAYIRRGGRIYYPRARFNDWYERGDLV